MGSVGSWGWVVDRRREVVAIRGSRVVTPKLLNS